MKSYHISSDGAFARLDLDTSDRNALELIADDLEGFSRIELSSSPVDPEHPGAGKDASCIFSNGCYTRHNTVTVRLIDTVENGEYKSTNVKAWFTGPDEYDVLGNVRRALWPDEL